MVSSYTTPVRNAVAKDEENDAPYSSSFLTSTEFCIVD
jgi:hypothetical protein